ncbi:MAG: 50S ribosomal protein L11 methyltransferase [Bdellovibrionales bacterium]|nr:50S ribosomal protein L11 methyltransferase [Bdellovibrionales bacterium]
MASPSVPLFTFQVTLPPSATRVSDGRELSRDEILAWIWERCASSGLEGVHEGSVFEGDFGAGVEPWGAPVLEAGLADPFRDWVGQAANVATELYFRGEAGARDCAALLAREFPGLVLTGPKILQDQDWNAVWKASFTGIDVPPHFQVVPPWRAEEPLKGEGLRLVINPGAGFGTGTHETTRLCLSLIGDAGRAGGLQGKRVLDFGSGSGILAIGAAALGARADAVEIDSMANDNARENARLNGVEGSMRVGESLLKGPGGHDGPYDLVVANILRPVLLEFREALVARLRPAGTLVLSGLIEPDVESVARAFAEALRARGLSGTEERRSEGDWFALSWKTTSEGKR